MTLEAARQLCAQLNREHPDARYHVKKSLKPAFGGWYVRRGR